MSEGEIRRETRDGAGRYVFEKDGIEAELTYSVAAPGVISADHTGVPDAFRGQGVGLRLAQRMVEDARAEGQKIIPRCSFIAAQARRHKDWADVIQG